LKECSTLRANINYYGNSLVTSFTACDEGEGEGGDSEIDCTFDEDMTIGESSVDE
jgi:hypothetical protein